MHVATAYLAALCAWRVDRLTGGVGLVVATGIAISTLFVKQHYVVDLVGGAALAYAAWRVCVVPGPVPDTGGSYPRWVALGPAALFGIGVLGCYLAYQAGWAP